MLDLVPWFIGGEAEHSPAVARMVAHAATQGSNGVIGFADLKVTALDIPGTEVMVFPGGAVIDNKYPGGVQQSYMARNISVTNVPVPATTSQSGATKYVILRIDDPEFGGQLPADQVNGPYVRFDVVNSITNLQYPHVALARIVMPASTGTITNAMITDLRVMANPRSRREIAVGSVANDPLNHPKFQWAQWPLFTPTVAIPSWATRVEGFARVHQPLIMTGWTYGQFKMKVGSIESGLSGYDFNQYGGTTNGLRAGTLSVVISAPIPEAMRGTVQPLQIHAYRSAETGYLRADASTQIEFDLSFDERPV